MISVILGLGMYLQYHEMDALSVRLRNDALLQNTSHYYSLDEADTDRQKTRLVCVISDQARTVLSRYEQLDPLTKGLHNRLGLDQAVQIAIASARDIVGNEMIENRSLFASRCLRGLSPEAD